MNRPYLDEKTEESLLSFTFVLRGFLSSFPVQPRRPRFTTPLAPLLKLSFRSSPQEHIRGFLLSRFVPNHNNSAFKGSSCCFTETA